jgi:hypothetical protein
VAGEAQQLTNRNEPFRGVILIPFNRIAIVHRELVVEIVVTFANRHKRRHQVVSRSMLIIKRRFTKPVSERVDAKRRLVGPLALSTPNSP